MQLRATGQTDETGEHRRAVEQVVAQAYNRGLDELRDILPLCEGADPAIVNDILMSLRSTTQHAAQSPPGADNTQVEQSPPAIVGGDRRRQAFRSAVSEFYCRLPASNPEAAQWWFDVNTVEQLVWTIAKVSRNADPVLCMGAPTVAFGLAAFGFGAVLLDNDDDVRQVFASSTGNRDASRLSFHSFDAAVSLENQRWWNGATPKYQTVFADPPWYKEWFRAFLEHAVRLLAPKGHLFFTLPPRLTRPSVETDRATVLEGVRKAGMEVMAIQRGALTYVVPEFERVVYARIRGFSQTGPWRVGDLVHCVAGDQLAADALSHCYQSHHVEMPSRPHVVSYSRKPSRYRVFLRQWDSSDVEGGGAASQPIRSADEYQQTVSSDGKRGGAPQVWSSEKKGLITSDENNLQTIEMVLDRWRQPTGNTRREIELSLEGRPNTAAILDLLDRQLGLWGRFEAPTDRREVAAVDTDARNGDRQREHGSDGDGYRTAFSRDRDRLVWSASMRKLANKTQVYPVAQDDEGRQRLTHSIEVAKLAATIGEALGLDLALIEAGGLAHDIGHTPFGHAGEYAMHAVLAQISSDLFFSHYEHGVDVVRYLEEPYQLYPGHPGLDLTRGVIETIYKHVYWHERPGATQSTGPNRPPASLADLHRRSKHSDYLTDQYCHPEGQAVRLVDKISYLLSDIEDGLRLGAIQLRHLRRCRLFQRPPIDMTSREGESSLAVFRRERRNIIRVLMEDAIEASAMNWNSVGRQYHRVAGLGKHLIDHSEQMNVDVRQVWDELQKGRLHRSSAVRLANMSAARIVSELVVTFALMPGLVDDAFRESHKRLNDSEDGMRYLGHYRERVGSAQVQIPPPLRSFLLLERTLGESLPADKQGTVKVDDLILAKDFVASLTDSQATRLHQVIPNGSTKH